jgi:acyl carrier protein
MQSTDQRLVTCFEAVFPDLQSRDIPKASAKNVSAWDSVATITLLSVVEEEFGVRFTPEQMEQATSFEAIKQQLK